MSQYQTVQVLIIFVIRLSIFVVTGVLGTTQMNLKEDIKMKLYTMIAIMSGSLSIIIFINKIWKLDLFITFETPKSILESSLKLLMYIWLAEYTSI